MNHQKTWLSILLTVVMLATCCVGFAERVVADPSLYTVEDFSIAVPEKDGIPARNIVGKLTIPADTTTPVPCVIMLHGTGSSIDEAGNGYLLSAPEMAAKGIATARFYFVGNEPETEENYIYYSYTNANEDAKTVADFVSARTEIDADKLGIMGWSQGGTNALLAAKVYPDTFKSVVTWAGSLTLNDAGLFGDKTFDEAYQIAKDNGYYTMEFGWRTPLNVGEKWFEDVKNTDLVEAIKEIKAPILAINGAADTVVFPKDAEIICENATNELSRKLILPGVDHTYNVFTGDYSDLYETADATIAFFLETLNGTK